MLYKEYVPKTWVSASFSVPTDSFPLPPIIRIIVYCQLLSYNFQMPKETILNDTHKQEFWLAREEIVVHSSGVGLVKV